MARAPLTTRRSPLARTVERERHRDRVATEARAALARERDEQRRDELAAEAVRDGAALTLEIERLMRKRRQRGID